MQPCGCMSTGTSNQSSADESNPRGSVARTEVKPRLTYSRVVLSSCCSRAQAERSPRVARETADGQIALRGSRSRWLTHPSLLAMARSGFARSVACTGRRRGLGYVRAAEAPPSIGKTRVGESWAGRKRRKPKVTKPRKKARDPAMARRLWEPSAELTGRDWTPHPTA